MSIRTRFAPSPTGYLHIGGVRTALFNWLLARRLGGQFVLRIDDTDTERNRAEALQPILDGFRWLGIQWDEGPEVGGPYGPYFQSQRGESYRAAALRFKIPAGRTIVVDDLIVGRCEQASDLLGDPVILRANGTALYNFASVVDDAALKITHVIRAREHLSNTYPQVLFLEALGLPLPRYAHVPVVNWKGEKMSKRKLPPLTEAERSKFRQLGWTDEQITASGINLATVAYYRELGYLPAAIINYLGRLGWSLDDKTEFMTRTEMIANFSLERVNDSPASFDPDKLYWLAG